MNRRLYRLLLYLYPAEIRRRFGEEMAELAHHQRGSFRFLAHDFLTSVVAAHMESRRARPRRAPRRRGGSFVLKDVELALRGMRRSPGFATIALITIALGIGANAAIFSVVNAVVLRPLPYDAPDRLVAIDSVYTSSGRRGPMSMPDVMDISDVVESFEAVATYRATELTLTGIGDAEVVPAGVVGGGLFDALGVAPLIGRDLVPEDNLPNGPRVAVIGNAFWQERFGGAFDVVGTTILLDDEPHEIVGVAPAGFDYPGGAQLWRPLYSDVEACGRGCHMVRVLARLAPDASLSRANDELSRLAQRLAENYSDTNSGKLFSAVPLDEALVGSGVKNALFVLFGAVALVLLIASANVAHLLLAKAVVRQKEMAVRAALGASRWRILRQLLVESFTLATLGGLAGLLLARWALEVILRLAPSNLPRLDQVSLDGTVLWFTLVAITGASLLFGLAPALSLSRTTLNASRHIGSDEPRGGAARPLLLAGEVALSLVLLFAAGLLLRSLVELRAQPLGFDREQALTFVLSLPSTRYPEPADSVHFFEELETRLTSLPSVEAAGAVYGSPMGRGGRMSADVTLLDRPEPPPGEEDSAVIRAVTPGYPSALGVPLVRGRPLEPRDRHGAPRVALVNESFVGRFYQGEDPIGKQIRLRGSFGYDESEPRTIVGVVGDIRSSRVSEPATPEVWAPQAQMGSDYLTVVVRARVGLDRLLPAVRAEVLSLDPNVPLYRVETLATAVERNIGETRFYFVLLAIFAGLALLLAGIGLYGVVSYLVSAQTREIGLRMALGADAGDVMRLVLFRGLRPTLIGVGLGIVITYLSARLLETMLYNVQPLDAATLVAVSFTLVVVAVAALWIPASRASKLCPRSSLGLD